MLMAHQNDISGFSFIDLVGIDINTFGRIDPETVVTQPGNIIFHLLDTHCYPPCLKREAISCKHLAAYGLLLSAYG
jgi:hypothetical protein